jgi:sulfofructose kinase
VEGGGQGGTSACCVSKLGGRVTLVGFLGDDEEGDWCLGRLADFKVDTTYIEKKVGGKTPLAYLFINQSTGKRTIIYETSTLPRIEIHDGLDHLISNTRTISLDPQTTYLAKSLKQKIHTHTKIIYDCERWVDGIEDMMAVADFFIPSSALFDAASDRFEKHRPHNNILKLDQMVKGQLIVTHGVDGAYYPLNGTLYHVKAPNVKVLDTTGAGDNFHGAFALAVSKKMDMHAAVRFAVAVASLSCRAYGGRAGLPEWEEAFFLSQKLTREKINL